MAWSFWIFQNVRTTSLFSVSPIYPHSFMLAVEALGDANIIAPTPCTGDTVTTICYTSGTTNVPKGVVLTHRNLVSAALSNAHGLDYVDGASVLSYLPLAHIYEVSHPPAQSSGGKSTNFVILACR